MARTPTTSAVTDGGPAGAASVYDPLGRATTRPAVDPTEPDRRRMLPRTSWEAASRVLESPTV